MGEEEGRGDTFWVVTQQDSRQQRKRPSCIPHATADTQHMLGGLFSLSFWSEAMAWPAWCGPSSRINAACVMARMTTQPIGDPGRALCCCLGMRGTAFPPPLTCSQESSEQPWWRRYCQIGQERGEGGRKVGDS